MRLPLALTMGEPAGIGGEIALAAWRRRGEGLPSFFLVGDAQTVPGPARAVASAAEAAAAFDEALPVLSLPLPRPVTPGKPDPANAPAVIAAIETAVRLALAGEVGGIVTNPIQKETLYQAGFRHPGHTEFIAELSGGATPAMMLVCSGLRVVPVTIHLPLREALAQLTTARIVEAGRIAAAALRQDFGIERPRLAVAGLNPHAGENGALGRDEIETIAPAVAALKAEGIDARGPAPADTLFHAAARGRYDAALCMYHDQALIPLKTIDFERGVNVTLGLPIVRTSPDHGTALGLAGKGTASAESLIAALRLAAEIAARRAK